MEILDMPGWRFFIDEENISELNGPKTGKWMYFYNNAEDRVFAEARCKESVERGIVAEAKVSVQPLEGVSCYYLKIDDLEGHKKVIQYFIEHDMIRRTKAGKLYNLSFKLNAQTRSGEYGESFEAKLKLEDLLDLNTGKWLV